MLNRDGSESKGYFGSNDMLEDLAIQDGDHIADELAMDLGLCTYLLHRIQINIKLSFWRLRRGFKENKQR